MLYKPASVFIALLLGSCAPSTAPPMPPMPAEAKPAEPTDPDPSARAKELPDPPALRLGDRVVPIGYEIALTLDPTKDSFTWEAGIEIELREAADHVWLHGADITIESATIMVGDEVLPIEKTATTATGFLGLGFAKTIGPGRARLQIAYTGTVATKDVSGLFRQEANGDWYLYSQFESISARRAFPCFDEPRFKVPWQIRVTAPRGLKVLSNTPATQVMKAADQKQTVVFAPTKPLPSYLIALAVGPFEIVDVGEVGRNRTPVRIVVPRGRTAETKHAAKSTREIQELLESYFDMGYPYAKLDHIVIPQFFGGMENPGLITYDDAILLVEAGKESPGFQTHHAVVVAHEIAHQWFGNLVTLEWWNDIWLNESFATWMAARTVDEWKPSWNGEVSAVASRGRTMQVDSLDTARRVRQPVDSLDDFGGLFDDISYGKGAAVLWMFERWVGVEAFRKGVRAYIRKHAGKTTTSSDFLAAISAVSKPEIPAAISTFIDQPGVPLVAVELVCEKQIPTVNLKQTRYLPMGSKASSQQRWSIPVCVKYGSRDKQSQKCTLMTDKVAHLTVPISGRCPSWVMANAGAAGYYRAAYGKGLLHKLFTAGRKHLSVPERLVAISDMSALVGSGKIGAGESLALVPTLLKDRNHDIVNSIVGIVASVDAALVPERLRKNYARFVRKMFGKQARKLGWKAKKGDAADTRLLRRAVVSLVANAGQDKRLIREARKLTDRWLDKRKGIDPDMLAPVMATAARHGDIAFHDRVFKAFSKSKGRERISLVRVLAAFRDPVAVKKNMEAYLAGKFELRESAELFGGALADPKTRQMVYDFVKDNFDEVVGKLPRFGRAYVVMVAGAFCDEKHQKDAAAFFGEKVKGFLNGPKTLESTLEQVELCTALRKAQEPSITRFLARY